MKLFQKRKVVLVLGGGAARGLSNVGVLKVIEQHYGRENLPFDLIVGSSIGGLIGASYSAGSAVAELEEKARGFTWPTLVDFAIGSTGLLRGAKLEYIIKDMIGEKTFNDLTPQFALTTTDIETGEELLHTSGDLKKLIRASCSWPGFFSSVEIDGRLLSDGGIRNSIPTKAAASLGATFIVAVNPGFAVKHQKIDNAFKALVQSIQIMGEELNSYQTKAADIAIKPDLKGIGQFDFDKADFIIRQGELAALEIIDHMSKKLAVHK